MFLMKNGFYLEAMARYAKKTKKQNKTTKQLVEWMNQYEWMNEWTCSWNNTKQFLHTF